MNGATLVYMAQPRRQLPTEESRALGRKLRAIRESLNLTQEDVGRRLGRDYRTVASYEHGRSHWKANDTSRWADAFGVSRTELESRLGMGLKVARDDEAFAAEAAAILGPDQGEMLAEVVDELADWPERERREILELIRLQTFNWPRRPSPDDPAGGEPTLSDERDTSIPNK